MVFTHLRDTSSRFVLNYLRSKRRFSRAIGELLNSSSSVSLSLQRRNHTTFLKGVTWIHWGVWIKGNRTTLFSETTGLKLVACGMFVRSFSSIDQKYSAILSLQSRIYLDVIQWQCHWKRGFENFVETRKNKWLFVWQVIIKRRISKYVAY